MVDVVEFVWQVPESSHRWIRTEVHRGIEGRTSFLDAGNPKSSVWALTDVLPDGSCPDGYRLYRPLDTDTGLYRRFIKIDPLDRDSIAEFADQFGMLGAGLFSSERTIVEKESTWQDEIQSMRLAIDMWRMFKDKDSAGLSQFLREPSSGQWQFKHRKDVINIEPVQNLFMPGNILIPAGFLVQRWINCKLEKLTSPRVLFDVDLNRRVFRIVPRSLLGAMWLQFAQTIDGSRFHKSCKKCSRWFEVSTEGTGKRINREFCSDKCKSQDYRDRLKVSRETITAKPIEPTKKKTTKRKGK